MSSRLDEARLENVCRRGDHIICRCPACFEQGHDKTGNHLSLWPSGAFACVQFPGDEGIEHRKRIFALVGVREEIDGGRNDHKPASKARSTRKFPTLCEAIGSVVLKLKMLATRRDIYHDENGNEHFVVVRFDGGGKKEFRPFHQTANGWVIADPPGKLPLFHLTKLLEPRLSSANQLDEFVFIVEGEKCVCALETLGGLLVTTSAHGSKSPHKSDWQPLAGRNVVILPDNDDDGQRYAQTVAEILLKLSPQAKVRIVALPELPKKGDCVDWLDNRDAQLPEDIKAELFELINRVEFSQLEKSWPEAIAQSVVSSRELERLTLTPRKKLLGDWLCEGDLGFIYAFRGTGKTWFGLAICQALSTAGSRRTGKRTRSSTCFMSMARCRRT